MASPRSFFLLHEPATSTPTRKKKVGSGQHKREELEREVSMLQNILQREQKVNRILEKAQVRQQVPSPMSTPDFIPPEAKELVAELRMVEDEIARLENQIKQIETELTQEKDVTAKFKQLTPVTNKIIPSNVSEYSTFAPNSGRGASPDQKKLFETKTLHFISKAIKGDYNLDDFGIANEKSTRTSRRVAFSDLKENKEARPLNQENKAVSSKNRILTSSSPLRTPRHPTPKRESNASETEMPSKYVGTNPSVQYGEEENVQKWSPNRLSENIVKCLILVYVRLLRTSRAMELEKSGPIARSSNFSSSFRVNYDTSGPNSKVALLQRESRQQDPYGVFDSEEAIPRDIGPYKNLVIFMSTNLDPKCLSNPSSIPLLQRLRVLLNGLQKVDLRYLTYQQKLAFWINMYNACVMHGFLQFGVPSSPEKLFTLMNKATLTIGGSTINAQEIEHFILRKPDPSILNEVYKKENKEAMMVHNRYGLEPSEPNVTFALCCGTRSSPAVRIYTAEGVAAELEKSKLEYLQASIIVTNTKRIAFPELLLRNMHGFAQDVDSLVEWVCHQLPTSGSLRKSMVECFRGTSNLHSNGKLSTVVQNIPYDFEFMYLLTV